MAITKQRIKKIEQVLDIDKGKTKEPLIFAIKNLDDWDEKAKRDFINRKIKQVKKKGGYNLLPSQFILVDKKMTEEAWERVKKLEKEKALQRVKS
ncbi:MAG: hypothetical protein COV00_03520 [Candidatus Tagabacteria bacterium CG10_big_fil_rev_8_21_14_0_10_40_13]|uniref:Uncharacterized protein n=1 Tax=Candidatus Tagabacteria bacterium CG10_big_fil_rev_8_21_14_0_10_40_13 TaxID=1975022 RepID=A0A2M8L870_9BACT|nr:MAG: hypothetical protein COV00_03520 [Candidatus Tagabacteria bacterium CG10_big_fil_rev_8_21_14_0_10_40_13]